MAIGAVDMLIPPSALTVLLGSLSGISISGLLLVPDNRWEAHTPMPRVAGVLDLHVNCLISVDPAILLTM